MLKKLKSETDFLGYLCTLKEILSRYVVFIAVADTGAAPYFTAEHAAAMADLGLKVDMTNRYRQPYIAIINKGQVVKELVSEELEKPLTVRGKLNKHDLFVYSAGFMCQTGIGIGAKVMIDGADYMRGGRGFNFLVFDVDNDKPVDNCSFDMFDMGKKIVINNSVEPALLSLVQKWGGCSYAHWTCRGSRLNIIPTYPIGRNLYAKNGKSRSIG